jgi:hypothetical protein
MKNEVMKEHKKRWRAFKLAMAIGQIITLACIFAEGFYLLSHYNPFQGSMHTITKNEPISTGVLVSMDAPLPPPQGITWRAASWLLAFAAMCYVLGAYMAGVMAKRYKAFDLPGAFDEMKRQEAEARCADIWRAWCEWVTEYPKGHPLGRMFKR